MIDWGILVGESRSDCGGGSDNAEEIHPVPRIDSIGQVLFLSPVRQDRRNSCEAV